MCEVEMLYYALRTILLYAIVFTEQYTLYTSIFILAIWEDQYRPI